MKTDVLRALAADALEPTTKRTDIYNKLMLLAQQEDDMAARIIRQNGEARRGFDTEIDAYSVRVENQERILIEVGDTSLELSRDELKKIADMFLSS